MSQSATDTLIAAKTGSLIQDTAMRPLAIIGNVNTDLILGPAAPWPKPGTEVIVEHDELRIGGSAGNSALVWQALGIDFQMGANIGDDQFGYWLRDRFGEKARHWPVEKTATTLTVGITHPDNERTFFTTRGHVPLLSFAKIEAMLDANNLQGGILLVCGAFLTDALTAGYHQLFDWAKHHQITLALDTGWPIDGWTPANITACRQWIADFDILLMNEVEITSLCGISDPTEAAQMARVLMPEGAIVVVKCGPDGALAIDPKGRPYQASAPQVSVIDTIGAGDVFNAGFLAALASGQNLQACLESGVTSASTAISTSPRIYHKPDSQPSKEPAR